MNVFKPSYYDEFKCIADKCKHSCCIGWEIDIDVDTMEKYNNEKSDFGKRLSENISKEETPHFVLGESERCPFLNGKNLCDIIINMGEGALCQICSDHPRFRSFFSDREEIGLGMCCEEAARVILSYGEKVKIEGEDCPDDEEAVFFNMREQIFAILQDREWTVDERIENLSEFYDLSMPDEDWAEVFCKLERLDEEWTEKIKLLKCDRKELMGDWDLPFEQLIIYFIYRHLSEAVYDGRYTERIKFAILSFEIIKHIFSHCGETWDNLIDICRMYSSEIEYSEENTEEILQRL